jgi:prepilin peptidase CpaA
MAAVVFTSCVVLAGLLVVVAAISDLLTMTIPNRIPLALVALFAVAATTGVMSPAAVGLSVATGVALFLVGVALFAAGVFGGGDAKLMPAVALFLGPMAVSPFILHTAVAGGILALLVLVARRAPLPAGVRGRPWIDRLMTPRGGIPYGIAIAWGTFAAAPHAPTVAAALTATVH